jgi:hypothetical protein
MVIAGLDPAIHDATPITRSVLMCRPRFIMDARVKPAHDRGKAGSGSSGTL